MRYEVWTQKPEYDSQHVLMMPAMSHDNEQELMRKGYQVCHVFDAESLERANAMFQDWVKTVSMERFCDGHPAWECTDECRGLPPPAKHPIEARMADEKFGPPRKTPGTLPFDDDVKNAIEKHHIREHLMGGDSKKRWRQDYIRALEDENAEMHQAMKEGRETVQALTCRIRDLERDYKAARAEAPSGMGALDLIRKELNPSDDETSLEAVRKLKDRTMALVDRNAEWAELSESLGWYDPHEVKALIDIRTKAVSVALEALERGQKLIEALMPGLRHIAVQNYQEVNEAPIAMAQAADALREALGIQLPENVSETDTESRQKE